MSKDKKRIRRSSAPPSQAVLNRRMREIWIDGLALFPLPHKFNPDQLRIALRELVEDEVYWTNMDVLQGQKEFLQELVEELKTPPGRARKNRNLSQPKEAKP